MIKSTVECLLRADAKKLASLLSAQGADCSVTLIRGQWSVFFSYDPEDAAHISGVLLQNRELIIG